MEVGATGTMLTSNDVTSTSSATVSTVSMSGTDNSTSTYYERMTSSGDALYLSGSGGSGSYSNIRPVFSVNLGVGDNGSTTGEVTQIDPTITAASYYNTGSEVSLQYFSDFTTDGSAVYVADSSNKLIRKIDLSTSNITTIAGKLENYADGTGENAEFRHLNKMLRVGTNLYVSDENRIRKVDSATGAVSTLQISGDSYNYLDRWTSDGTDIYFSSDYNSSGVSGYKLYKMSSTGVVSALDLESDNGSFTFSNHLYGLTSVTYTHRTLPTICSL